MDTIAAITALVIAAGTIFSAIYTARSNTEKTLKEHIEKLDKDIAEMQDKYTALQGKYDALSILYEKERRRSDRLARKVASLTKKG